MNRTARTKTAIVLFWSGLAGIFALDRGAGLLSQEVTIGLVVALCVGGVLLLNRWIAR